MKKDERLIETKLPIAEISEEAKNEKMGWAHPPTSQLLFWWTSKPLIASRAAVLGAFLNANYDLAQFRMHLGLRREKRAYYYSPIPKALSRNYRALLGRNPKILDSFAGSGRIPFETIRAGLDSDALEYNPVAYILLHATLNYPRIYGSQLAEDVKRWGGIVAKRAQDETGHLYPKHNGNDVTAYIWAWMAECARCGQKTPLVLSWWLSRKRQIAMRPIFLPNKDFDIEFTNKPPDGTCFRGRSNCIKCGAPIGNEQIKKEVISGKRKLLCTVVAPRGSIKFEKPTKKDLSALEEAETLLKEKWEAFDNMNLVPTEEIPSYDTRSIWVVLYGIDKWYKLFSTRQLLALLTLAKHIIKASEEIEQKKGKQYAKTVVTYLALTLCQHARFNCLGTTWNSGGAKESISHALSSRGLAMAWDHAEPNPFTQGSGTWANMLEAVVNAIKFASECLSTGAEVRVHLGSALNLPFGPGEFDAIVTDPPYLDDVPYGELSEFYNVWLWRILHTYYPELPGPKVPVDEELDHNPGRHGSEELSLNFYEGGLTQAFKEADRVLKDNGLFVVFFAHSKLAAWKMLINSLIKSGFRVTMTWPIHTESPTNLVQRGKASIQSSIFVVARKRGNGGTAFLEDLRGKIAEHVRRDLEEISDLKLIGADLIVAGLGKALEVATAYAELKSYSGNATLESLLEVVSEAVYSYSVESLVNRPLAALDPQTAFYVFVKCGYGGLIPPDDALMICKGAGVELQVLRHEKVIDKKKVGGRTVLATLNAHERGLDPNKPLSTPSILNQLHLLELAVNREGKRGFDRLLSSATFRAGDVRAVAEGLYNGLLLIKKNDPEIELLRPIIDLYKTGAPTLPQKTIDKYLTGSQQVKL